MTYDLADMRRDSDRAMRAYRRRQYLKRGGTPLRPNRINITSMIAACTLPIMSAHLYA